MTGNSPFNKTLHFRTILLFYRLRLWPRLVLLPKFIPRDHQAPHRPSLWRNSPRSPTFIEIVLSPFTNILQRQETIRP